MNLNKNFLTSIKLLVVLVVIYLIVFVIVCFDISNFKYIWDKFIQDFSRFFPTRQEEFALTPIIYSFFLLIIPFFFYILAYARYLFDINSYFSYLFHWHKFKKYLKPLEQHVFNEDNVEIEIDISGNFQFANMIVYDYIFILLTVLPCGLILAAFYISISWEDISMDDEDEIEEDRRERVYESLETSLSDEHYYKNQLMDLDVFQYHRTEREIKDVQEESLDYVMEDENLEMPEESLDFLETLSQTISNLIFNKIYSFLPISVVNFFKFSNTELALKNLLIFLLYFPCFFYVIFKHFFRFFKYLFFKK
jgi:hypothetical protein